MITFEELYTEHAPTIRARIAQRVDRADVDDLLSDTMLAAWRSWGTFEDRGAPVVAWLHTIAHNVIVSYYRKQRPANAPLEAVTDQGDVCAEAEARIAFADVRHALGRLCPRDQQVITLRFAEDRTFEDIAAQLGTTPSSARVFSHRAVKRLRAELAEEIK